MPDSTVGFALGGTVDDGHCHAFDTKDKAFMGVYALTDIRDEMKDAGHKACRKLARFRVGNYVTCCEHLSYVVMATSPDWDGNMVAVEILRPTS